VALRDLSVGEAVTVCKAPLGGSLEERIAAMKQIGVDLSGCACARCRFERRVAEAEQEDAAEAIKEQEEVEQEEEEEEEEEEEDGQFVMLYLLKHLCPDGECAGMLVPHNPARFPAADNGMACTRCNASRSAEELRRLAAGFAQ